MEQVPEQGFGEVPEQGSGEVLERGFGEFPEQGSGEVLERGFGEFLERGSGEASERGSRLGARSSSPRLKVWARASRRATLTLFRAYILRLEISCKIAPGLGPRASGSERRARIARSGASFGLRASALEFRCPSFGLRISCKRFLCQSNFS